MTTYRKMTDEGTLRTFLEYVRANRAKNDAARTERTTKAVVKEYVGDKDEIRVNGVTVATNAPSTRRAWDKEALVAEYGEDVLRFYRPTGSRELRATKGADEVVEAALAEAAAETVTELA